MNNRMGKMLICIAIAVVCLFVGGIVLEAMLTGVITFIGLVALIESITIFRWLVVHTYKLIDVSIFVFGVYAKVHFGVTIAIGIMFAGLCFTLIYGPYIRETYHNKSKN